ncbi:hypothetical protein [Ostreibacterium oceani]|nr:hypothetical protein [Ostreibacterium oceani]
MEIMTTVAQIVRIVGQIPSRAYHDKVGNILKKTTEHGVYDYSYDAAYRLIQANHPTLDNETYSYDKVGNRLSDLLAGTGQWQYNARDQLINTPLNNFQYDTNGNTSQLVETASNLTTDYAYDVRQRLVSVTRGGQEGQQFVQQNTYDLENRRVKKTVQKSNDSQTTYYFYTHNGLTAEFDERGEFIQGYLYEPNSPYTTNPLVKIDKAGDSLSYSYYQNDHLGTPRNYGYTT